MTTTAENTLPLIRSEAPADPSELADIVRQSFADRTPIYTIGGGTSLLCGLPARAPGVGLSVEKLHRVVDYPSRDMTVTVEAGIRLADLAQTLACENQWLPVDAAQAAQATIGGVIATNGNGPRRFGQGTIRDYVIGISAVDGRGVPFKAGGRVVKNVAGYDFCKLLVGSQGTLATITQVTLKTKPRPEASAFVACDVRDYAQADSLLASLVTSQTTPVAVELLVGTAWQQDECLQPIPAGSTARLVVGLEGSQPEVEWMIGQLTREWHVQGVDEVREVLAERASALWRSLIEFPTADGSPLVLKIGVRPSAVCQTMQLLTQVDAGCSIQAHAGNGILFARLGLSSVDASRAILGRLQPAVARGGGHVMIWSTNTPEDFTRQTTWGSAGGDVAWMRSVKEQFDPQDLLNPGRFVYGNL
jgi:glycolate oxidase FAD binding subunit